MGMPGVQISFTMQSENGDNLNIKWQTDEGLPNATTGNDGFATIYATFHNDSATDENPMRVNIFASSIDGSGSAAPIFITIQPGDKSLAPNYPAANDGEIDDQDVESGNVVATFNNMDGNIGQPYGLFFGSYEYRGLSDGGELVTVKIPPRYLTDGTYPSAYYLTDLEDNTTCSGIVDIRVSTTGDETRQLKMIVSTHAPFTASDIPFTPLSWGMIIGSDNAIIQLSCNAPGAFSNSKSQHDTVQLDNHGIGYFSLYSYQKGRVNINATVDNNNQNEAKKVIDFVEYTDGLMVNSRLKAYASTTGGPADGITPCTIYLVAEPDNNSGVVLAEVNISLSGNATFKNSTSNNQSFYFNDSFYRRTSLIL